MGGRNENNRKTASAGARPRGRGDMPVRERVFHTVQIGTKDDVLSRAFDLVLVVNILVNITAMFMETFSGFEPLYPVLRVAEWLTTAAFVAEYLLRIWTADYLYPGIGKGKAVLRFLVSFDGIVELLTILPMFFLSGFVVFRMLRVVRIFHLFRINNQYDSFNVITSVLYEKRNQIFSSLFILVVLMFGSSLCMYNVEHEAQPEQFKNAFSGLWWSVSALLTVGYGDVTPITELGRFLGIIIEFLGVGVVAIPTGIISAGFVEQYSRKEQSDTRFSDIGHIGEIRVLGSSPLKNRTVGDIRDIYHMSILVILRDDMTIVATDGLKVREDDILVVESREQKLGRGTGKPEF